MKRGRAFPDDYDLEKIWMFSTPNDKISEEFASRGIEVGSTLSHLRLAVGFTDCDSGPDSPLKVHSRTRSQPGNDQGLTSRYTYLSRKLELGSSLITRAISRSELRIKSRQHFVVDVEQVGGLGRG